MYGPFPLLFVPRLSPKSEPARGGGYSWEISAFRDPMPSEPSFCRRGSDVSNDVGPDIEAVEVVEAVEAWGCSSSRLSRNVMDGTKKRLPVTARLKSSRRS